MSKVKKVFKIIGIILLSLIVLFLLFILVSFINHRIKSKSEWSMLEEKGYVNLVQAQDYKLNAAYWGNEEGEHTIVGISGMGMSDFPISLKRISEGLEDDNLFICLDRAGYGLSDDTKIPQTCETVVENYRTALKNGGFEAPYIIVAHSLGGVYTTYWESVYPDEIEGILLLDSTPVANKDIFPEEDMPKIGALKEFLYTFSCDVGLDRFFPNLYWTYLPEFYTDEEIQIHDALWAYSSQTHAIISENNNVNDSCWAAYRNMKTTDIPKTYIASSYYFDTVDDFKQFIEIYNADMRRQGQPEDHRTDEEYQKIIGTMAEFWESEYVPYLEKLGNCEVEIIPLGHMAYVHRPEEVGDILTKLIERVDAV